jgi:hypothetical protein
MTNQTTKVTLAQLATLSGTSILDIQNWLKRLPLTTRYVPTTQGKAQGFTRDNAMEILLLSRMVRNRMPPAAAVEYIAKLFKEIRARKPHGWAIFFTGGNMPIDYMVTDKPPSAEFLSAIDGAFVINVAKLETDVDEFFAELSDD